MSVAYKIQVHPEAGRLQQIATLSSASTKVLDSWDVYESKPEPLKVITLPLGVPLYRMANGRTQTDQMAYIRAANAEDDFFSSHEADVGAQQAQHKILDAFARDGKESITPIFEELARTGQTEPILITTSGVVVNGNRRLCAMRELYASGQHPRFAEIDCAVLPPLTPEQIDDVEDRLQMRPETKLPYTWTNDAIRVRKRLEAKQGKEDVVARLMRRGKADISKAIAALGYADIYLKDWRKSAYSYDLVADGQQFFYDLPARLKGKDGSLREANMKMAWILFDNRSTLGGRIYDFNRVIGEKAAEVLDKLSERIDLDDDDTDEGNLEAGASAKVNETSSGYPDSLEIDFGPEEVSDPYATLVKALDDPSKRDDVVDHLKVVCQTIIDTGKAKKEGNSALVSVRDAHTRLTEADLTKADPKTYDAIAKQLGEVAHSVAQLQTKLAQIQAGLNSSSEGSVDSGGGTA